MIGVGRDISAFSGATGWCYTQTRSTIARSAMKKAGVEITTYTRAAGWIGTCALSNLC